MRGKRLGFSLADIREMIDLYDLGDGRQTQRMVAMERCRDRIAALEQQKHDIDAAITELSEFVGVLEAGTARKE
jgi:DNA-binding transcriptional MerR regulator